MASQSENSQTVEWYRRVWRFLILVAGYPVYFLILIFSPKTSAGFWGDLRGAEGRKVVIEWGESILVAFILAMTIRTFFFEPFKIPSGSMIPTLLVGDRLFVNKLTSGPLFPFSSYRFPGFSRPHRGDVVVFRYPVTRDKDFIKRLIAFGGETVEIRSGQVLINGAAVVDGSIAKVFYYNRGDFGAEGRPIKVPQGYYFVMGDNSGSSMDSRYWGFVPESLVIGRAEFLFWPINRVGKIK